MSHEPVDAALAKKAADTIRFLAVDAIQKANSGHPGMPMGAADMAFVLFSRFLQFDSGDPSWIGRDRFILSAGHGSMLQYAMLHLFGYDLPMEQIKRFRQFDSKTPGHPEFGLTPGVELTTGPLGQGFANGVGMALAAKITQARFERGDFCPSGTRIFGIVSDGDLMEGISYEAAALAGHWKLGNLVYLYDSNGITIEGCTDLAWSENVKMRFEAAGWDVHTVLDGHDHEAIAKAVQKAVDCAEKPSLVVCRTHIGYGSPKFQDQSGCHGSPLGPEEILETKKALGWTEQSPFFIPEDVQKLFTDLTGHKKTYRAQWETLFSDWKMENSDLMADLEDWFLKELPAELLDNMIAALPEGPAATRALSGKMLQQAAKALPNLIGGSADLSPSNKSVVDGKPAIEPGDFSGRNLHFGIREHAMGAIANGMALYGTVRPYTATFLVFADYMRPTLRMAALMEIPTIFIFTHDSFWVGEDGPTHQPIEHLASLRLIPNLHVFRPGDGVETAVAWERALARTDGPSVLVMTRQKLEPIGKVPTDLAKKGGYVIADTEGADLVLIASGSEVATCVAAKSLLEQSGRKVRVVSMLCQELFELQDKSYKQSVIPPNSKDVFWVEAGKDPIGYRYVKGNGTVIGLDRFGASAPGKVLADYFGFTPEKIARKIGDLLG